MYRTMIALALAAFGAAQAGAQTTAPKPLPPATVARIRAETRRFHEYALHGRAPAERAPRGHEAPRSVRSAPARPTFTPRPPKARPAE